MSESVMVKLAGVSDLEMIAELKRRNGSGIGPWRVIRAYDPVEILVAAGANETITISMHPDALAELPE